MSTFGLIVTVALGAYLIDKRFTMLLVPPYMVYWSTENDLSQIPILRFVNSWWAKLPLALMGLACGFAMHYLIEGGSIRDLVDEAAKQAQQLA